MSEPLTCRICGRPTSEILEVVFDDYLNQDTVVAYCPTCINAMYTCATCAHSIHCDYDENPLQIPPVIRQEIRQGPMTIVREVPNPERIRQTCLQNCKCASEEKGCQRIKYGLCPNWEEK